MSTIDRPKGPSGRPAAIERDPSRAGRRGFGIRRSMAVILLAVSTLAAACTPGEIEQSIQMLNVSFEEGGLEGGLSSAALLGQNAVLVIGMRLGSLAP